MNIEHLRAFLEVVATGSFQLAAEKMHVTQSTCSARIKVLEERLNQSLFVRKRTGAELTAAGHLLHRHALTAVQAWERARQDIALPNELLGVFSLGIQLNHWELIAPPWLDWMQQRAPDIATRLISDYSEPLMRLLRDGLLDMAIVYTPQQRPRLTMRKYMDEAIIPVSTTTGNSDLIQQQDYLFVDWGEEFRTQHSLAFPEITIPRMSVGLGSIGLSHILKHGGSGYFLENMVKPYLERGQLRRIVDTPDFTHTTWLAYPKSHHDLTLQATAIHGLRNVSQSLENFGT